MDDAKRVLDKARSNQQYKEGFEWRMEFPEVLDDSGNFIGFDLVIGNPPYISVEGISAEMKDLYKSNYKSFYKRSDLFALFVERGLSIAADNGVVMMIVPSVVHSNISYDKLRNILLDGRLLAEVCYTGGDIFKATVDTTILQLDKSSVSQIVLKKAFDFDNPIITTVPANYFEKFNNVISVDETPAGGTDIYEKLFPAEFASISDYFNIFQGIVTGNNPAFIFDDETLALEHFEPELLHPLCHGRDIGRYEIRSRSRRIAYINSDININDYPKAKEWLLTFKDDLDKRNVGKSDIISWSSLHRPRSKSDLDTREKILVQATRNEALEQRILATIDDRSVYGSQGVNFIIPTTKTYDLYCLLGILNSKLINYLFATKFLNLAIKAEYLKEIKIPSVDSRIGNLVG